AHIIGKQDDEMCNPIVMKVWDKKPADIKEFYEIYLEERLKYLKSCSKMPYETLPFLHADRMRWQEHDADFYRAKASRYLSEKSNGSEYDKAIELPRGLFEKYIREELMAMDKMKTLAEDESKNISYLIYGYFRNVQNDDCPPIYESKRTYPLFNRLYRLTPQDPAVYLTAQEIRQRLMRNNVGAFVKKMEEYVAGKPKTEQKAEKEQVTQLLRKVKDNETTLKRYKIQDIILFMIAKKILSDEQDKIRNSVLDDIHLKDIQDKDALSQKVDFSVTVKTRNGYKKRVYQKDMTLK
ncbi:MAG: hypothetical protein Q4A15_01685, partial [Prevotellaceae bacterium]|nr:hypothetical protein [Prevotellaceae bacterium]